MMEKVDRSGQEEFIWAMKLKLSGAADDDVSSSWRDRLYSKTSMTSSLSVRRSVSVTEVQTKVLASLVPDEVIYDSNNFASRNYEACVLFGHISGLDRLYQKFNNSMAGGGSSLLTQILNTYLGSMIQEILLFCGDVIKLNGDSLLALWKPGINNQTMPDCIHQAIDCALSIQKSCGSFVADSEVTLKVKIIIGSGDVIFKLLGDNKRSYYVLFGAPILGIHSAQKIIDGGEIAISTSACDYVNINEYIYELLGDNTYAKIIGAAANWRSSQRNFGRTDYNEINTDQSGTDKQSTLEIGERNSATEIFELRPALAVAVSMDLKDDLEKFITPSVMRGIEMDEPIEYLTEMRNIVLLYVDIYIENPNDELYLRIVDICYRKVGKIASEMDGCISQVTLLDKNVRFMLIFGFRGFKHALESRRGLFCAMTCYNVMNQIESVLMVTISVTTGMAYCGAIGHALRREYTVMSIGVNNASLFIDAYPGKITCDRDTFLQSKLDPMQFVLQEVQMSVSSTGPIYQFVEATSNYLPKYPINQYPILDRENEVNIYLKMLDMCSDKEKVAEKLYDKFATEALVVHGRPKEGKTRLTEEYLFRTPSKIPIFRIQLIPSDKVIPYQAIYFLFSVPMGIKENSTVSDREAKLISKLKHFDSPQLFCMLNLVFKVNFVKSTVYSSFTEHQKFYALNKIIKLLCYSCFTILWVVIIDGGDNMDDESWSIIKTIIDTGKIFVVITVTNLTLSPIAELVLNSPNIKTIHLLPIEKWYHVGLACQFLNVAGIPADLEKVLHSKSTGNAGWIESYLISLVHSGALKIRTIPISAIKDYGLVLSPLEMLKRISECAVEESNSTSFKFAKPTNSAIFFNIQDKWKIYKHSFKDSTTDVMNNTGWSETSISVHDELSRSKSSLTSKTDIKIEGDFEKQFMQIDICVIKEGANIDDITAESTLDSFVIKVLDYLTSYEQLLLKCSSVIGETLSRDMLHYLMNKEDVMKCALAVQRLFEIGVLGCAQGNFNYGGSNAILNPPTISDSGEIECRCIGLRIREECEDLPKYASCGYLYFKIVSFREMTYSLLTLHQRKEFHSRAIRYLEKKTRKCIKCGGGLFTRIVGTQYDEVEKKKKGTMSSQSSNYSSAFDKKKSMDRSTYDVGSISTFKSSFKSSIGSTGHSLRGGSSFRRHELTRSFSSNDFSSCDCTRILFSMYKQVVEHSEAIGLLDKWLASNLEYGRMCIDTYNIPLALKVLNKTLNMFQENHASIVKVGESWKAPFIKAKILTLLAKARVEIGQIKTAFTIFEEALKNFSYSFPSKNSLKFKLINLQHYLYLMHNKRYGMKLKHDYTAEYCDNVSECLNLLCGLFIELELYGQAETTAICSLKKVLQSEKNFVILINAFTNIMLVNVMKRRLKHLAPLEIKALSYCQDYSLVVDIRDLEAVMRLYIIIFKARVIRCDFESAINIGDLLIKIGGSINRKVDSFDLYPLLIQVLILKNRVCDAVMIFSMVEQSSVDELDHYDLTWYYALCVCFHLDTGHYVLPFKECENYRFVDAQNFLVCREPTAQKRYYVVLWLWLLRNGKFEEAEIWEAKIHKTWNMGKYERLVNLFTGLYYLEGLILVIVLKMDRMNHVELDNHIGEINKLFGILHYHAQYAKMIEPRLYHLKAFYLLTMQQDSEAFSMLSRARKIAVETGNVYDEHWIIHSEMAWKQDMSSIDYHFWRDHSTGDLLSYHLLENEDKLGFYTLEPPLYS